MVFLIVGGQSSFLILEKGLSAAVTSNLWFLFFLYVRSWLGNSKASSTLLLVLCSSSAFFSVSSDVNQKSFDSARWMVLIWLDSTGVIFYIGVMRPSDKFLFLH